MTTPELTNPQKSRINTARILSAVAFLATAIMSAFNGTFAFLGEILQNANGISSVSIYHYVIVQVLLPIGSLALAAGAVFLKNVKVWFWTAIGFFLFTVPLSWIMLQVYFQASGYPLDLMHFQITESNGVLDTAILIALCLATGLAIGSKYVGDVPVAESSAQLPSESVQVGPASNLPLFALVGSFVMPLVGVILGHIAISQMNRGQISSANRNFARIGLIVGYVLTAIGLLALIFVVAVLYQFGYFTAHYW